MSGIVPLPDSDDAPEDLGSVEEPSAPPQEGHVVAPPEAEPAPPADRKPERTVVEGSDAEEPEPPAEGSDAEEPESRDEPVQEPTVQDGTDAQTPAADGAVPVDAADVPTLAQESTPVDEPAEKEPAEPKTAAEEETAAEVVEPGEPVEVVDSAEEPVNPEAVEEADAAEVQPAEPGESVESGPSDPEAAEPGEPAEAVDSAEETVESEAVGEADAAEETAAGAAEPAQEEQPAEPVEPKPADPESVEEESAEPDATGATGSVPAEATPEPEPQAPAEAPRSKDRTESAPPAEEADAAEEQLAEPVEPEPADPESAEASPAESVEPEPAKEESVEVVDSAEEAVESEVVDPESVESGPADPETAEPGEPVEVVGSVESGAAEEADAAEKTAAGAEEPAQEEQPAEAAELTESEAAETQPAESAVEPESVEPADSAAGSDAAEPAVEPESAESETAVEAAGPVEVAESTEPNEPVESGESADAVVEPDAAEEAAAGSGTAAEEAQSAEPAIKGESAEEAVDEATPAPPSAGATPTERASEAVTAGANVAHPPLRPNFSLSAPTPATAAEPATGAPSRTIEYPADAEAADMSLPPSVPIAARTPEKDDACEEAAGTIGTIGRAPADSEAEEVAAASEAADDESGVAAASEAADDESEEARDEQVAAEPAPPEQKKSEAVAPARRRRLLLALGAAALLVLVWGATAFATTQHIFAGSTVSGVAVGNMSPAQAQSAVAGAIDARLGQPVTLVVGNATDTLVPAESGVSVDARASVERLTGFTLNPLTLIERLRGADVDAVTRVDVRSLTTALDARLGALAVGASDAGVTLNGTTPVLIPGSIGTGLDVDSAVTTLSENWPLGRETIELPSGEARPAVTDEEAQTLIDEVLIPLLSGNLTITAEGTDVAARASRATVALTPEQLAALTRIGTADGDITASLDPQGLREAVLAAMGQGIETPAQDATWTIEGRADAKPVYVEAHGGTVINADALAADALTAATRDGGAGSRSVTLPVIDQAPAVTTPAADWGMNQIVGEYSTPYYPDAARTQNLVAGTAAINGTIVMPGEVFSLTDALGPIDEEHGFASAGVVTNGQHTDAIGGGLSQVATTVFNAGFEAGMDDVEHTPHNYWFTRYPAGREATLWTGNLDVKFGNSTPTAVMVQAWAVDGEVHVRLWGTPYYRVSIDNGTPHNYRAYQTQRQKGANCVPYGGGAQGFDITVTRSRTKPDGQKLPDDVLSTSYDSDNPIVCG